MIVVQTPLRISFLGGGTDLKDYYAKEGGAVLSTAISLCVYIIVKKRFDDKIYVNYSKKEIVDNVDSLEHELVREAMHLTGVRSGIEITTLADITSEGTGLGSSSSFTVGMLHALYAYQGELPTAEKLADEACRIEIDVLQHPIGKQDQYIAAYGNMRFIKFEKSSVSVEKVELPSEIKQRLNRNLMLFFTGKHRRSSTILESQKENINQRLTELTAMKQLAYEARECLQKGELDNFGEILHRGWEYKKTLTEKVSNSDIDRDYALARQAGAIGGKLCGAGGGGFLLIYCRPEKQEEVRYSLKHLTEYTFNFQQDGSKVIFNYQG
jgi:D-glycero-alpha-D-manno-heptose-7-phosphate kinase